LDTPHLLAVTFADNKSITFSVGTDPMALVTRQVLLSVQYSVFIKEYATKCTHSSECSTVRELTVQTRCD